MALCNNCHGWWVKTGMPVLRERGQQALRGGGLHPVSSNPNADPQECEVDGCDNLCASNSSSSSSRLFTAYGFVDKEDRTCCRQCFSNAGGYMSTNAIYDELHTLFDTDRYNGKPMNDKVTALLSEFDKGTSEDEIRAQWHQAGVELASKLYDRPGSAPVALQLIRKAIEQKGRVHAMAFLAVAHQ